MEMAKAIIEMHSIFKKKTSEKDANLFIRARISNIMAELQELGEFSVEKLEKAISYELQELKKMDLKK